MADSLCAHNEDEQVWARNSDVHSSAGRVLAKLQAGADERFPTPRVVHEMTWHEMPRWFAKEHRVAPIWANPGDVYPL